MATKNSKNVELSTEFKAQIESGKPFIFAKNTPVVGKDTKSYQTLFIAQAKKENGNTVNALFLGWDSRILRTVRNATAEISAKFPAGTTFDDLSIQVVENTTKGYEGQEPKVNPSSGEVITFEGQPVYEHTELVPTVSCKDVKLPRTKEVLPQQKAESMTVSMVK